MNGTIAEHHVDSRYGQQQQQQQHVQSHHILHGSAARHLPDSVDRPIDPIPVPVVDSRRASPPPPPQATATAVPPQQASGISPEYARVAVAVAVYGTALPPMASPTSVAAAILAAAGSSSSSGPQTPQSTLSASSGTNATGTSSTPVGNSSPEEEALSTQQVLERFNTVYPRITALGAEVSKATPGILLADLPPEHELHSLWIQIPAAVHRSVTADEAGMAVAQKTFRRFFDDVSDLVREINTLILDGLRESCRRLSKELSSWLSFSEDWKKLHRDGIVALMKAASLLNKTAYDETLAKMIDNGRNTAALDFACFLVNRVVIQEPLATAAEMYATLEVMSKIGRRSNPPSVPSYPDGLSKLVENARSVVHKPSTSASPAASTSGVSTGPNDSSSLSSSLPHSNVKNNSSNTGNNANNGNSNSNGLGDDPADPAGAREIIATMLLEWQRILASDTPNRPVLDQTVIAFLNQIRANMLSTEEARERFFRITIELVSAVTRSASQSRSGGPPVGADLIESPYTVVEATVRLIATLCRLDAKVNNDALINNNNNSGAAANNNANNVATNEGDVMMKDVVILCQFLSVLVKDILKNSGVVDLRPQFRLFSGLIAELAIGSMHKHATARDYFKLTETYFISNVADMLDRIKTKADALEFLSDKSSGYVAFVRHSYGFTIDEQATGGSPNASGDRISLDNVQVICAIVGALSACSSTCAANFIFSWLQLISDRDLMPTMLSTHTRYGWPLFRHLMCRMMSYLGELLTEPGRISSNAVRTLYGGVLRVLLVLLHDFSEFLCSYHMDLVEDLPRSCVQMRNLVSASFPRSMRLPDPFSPSLNVEELPEMMKRPLILSNYLRHLQSGAVRDLLDDYMGLTGVDKSGNNLLAAGASCDDLDIDTLLKVRDDKTGELVYSAKRASSIVMYVGQRAIVQKGVNNGNNSNGNNINNYNSGGSELGVVISMKDKASELLRKMFAQADGEGRHEMLNGIANQLRYPNNNTLYFSQLFLVLFQDADSDVTKEHITRVLVERLIANRPHPWGLLITFVQLVKNVGYNFWNRSFIHCIPEVEQLFEQVAKLCIIPNAHPGTVTATNSGSVEQAPHASSQQQNTNSSSNNKTQSLLAASS